MQSGNHNGSPSRIQSDASKRKSTIFHLHRWIGILSAIGAIVVGFILFATFFMSMVLVWINGDLLVRHVERNFDAVIGIPLAAAASFALIAFIERIKGDIKIEVGWLKFEGAAAPILFWVVVFTSFIIALKILWTDQ